MHIIKGLILACALVAACVALPASAVVLEISYKGTVVSANETAGTLVMAVESRYGCSYDENGSHCQWNPIASQNINGSAKNPVFKGISVGDTVEGRILGGDGGKWKSLAKIITEYGGKEVATRVYGDPSGIQTPLAAGYTVATSTIPDCSTCSGTVCDAAYGSITISDQTGTLVQQTVGTGEPVVYNMRTDGSSVDVMFDGGTSSRDSCPVYDSPGSMFPVMTGIQAQPYFIIWAVPAIPPQPVPTPLVPTMKVNQNGETYKRVSAGSYEESRYSFVKWKGR